MPSTCERKPSFDSPRAATAVAPSPALLHVLTITPFFPSAEDDADGCFIAEVLPALQSEGIKNSVIAARPIYRERASPVSRTDTTQRLRYLSVPSWPGLASSGAFLYTQLLPKVRRIHAQQPIDLIHAHSALPSGHAAALLAKKLKLPFVVSVHGRDAYFARQVPGPARAWCRHVSSMVYSSARRVICVSDVVREEVQAVLPKAQCSVIYNGVDTAHFSADPDCHPRDGAVLAVGNLIPSKGHESLLHAIAALGCDFPALCCEIVGTGPAEANLRRLAEKVGISHQVHFLGRMSRQLVADAYRRCSIFVLPSTCEALGCVYLEAMAAGRPVIGCRGQGIAELIDHGRNGFLVDPQAPDQIARLLRCLIQDASLRSRMGIAARRTVVERFTLEHQASGLAQVYRECTQ